MTDAAGSAVTPGVAAPDAMTTVMSHVSDNSTNPASGNSAVSDVDDGGSSGITAASVDSSVVTLLAVLDQSPNAVLQVWSCADGASLPFDFQHRTLLPALNTQAHTHSSLSDLVHRYFFKKEKNLCFKERCVQIA